MTFPQHDENEGRTAHLVQLKNQLRSKYLGRCGIHAFGIRSDEDAICVYITETHSNREEAIRELRTEVGPHALIVIVEPPAGMQ